MSRDSARLFDVPPREERPLALLMSAYFFLVITSFWILKPLKKTLFIAYYDLDGFALGSFLLTAAQAELLAKVLNMGVAAAAVVVFSALARGLRRERLTYAFCAFFVLAYAAYALAITDPSAAAVWSFYLFGDLFSTLMVATFFAFLNDSVDAEEAKRIYGLVGLGGVLGGVFGTTTLTTFIDALSIPAWLGVNGAIAVAIAGLAAAAGRLVRRQEAAAGRGTPPGGATTEPAREEAGHPAIAGARLVSRSSYLLAIVAIVGLYEVVSTILDYQFSATVAHYLDGRDAIGRHFSRVYSITNAVSFGVQLLLTSFVMRRFGLTTALLVLPFAVLGASGAFLAVPALWVGSMLNTADGGFAYSIHQSAKEALYVPTTRDEKYYAKAFIDMLVQRSAKALAVGLSLGITLVFDDFGSIRWLSALTLPLLLVWGLAARHAGRRFDELADAPRPE